MPMVHFLPLLPETSAPYTPPASDTSSASSSRSSSISYTSGPSSYSLLNQIRNLTQSLTCGDGDVSGVENLDAINREVDYLSYFVSAPLSLTPALPGRSNAVEVEQLNQAIRDLNQALAGFSGATSIDAGSRRGSVKGRESTHRHKLSVSSHHGGEQDARLRMLRRYE